MNPSDARLRKRLRILAQHCETIAHKARVVERLVSEHEITGEHGGVKIQNAVKDIETRARMATRLIGIDPEEGRMYREQILSLQMELARTRHALDAMTRGVA